MSDREAAIREALVDELTRLVERQQAELAAAREREAKLREKARAAKSVAAAPDYDEEAIRDALWAVVDAALADGEGET